MVADPATLPTEELLARLRRWAEPHDGHVRAAVGLLIEHGFWLRRRDFVSAAVRVGQYYDEQGRVVDSGEAYLDWSAARRAFDGDEVRRASSTERAVLDLAIALGEDRFLLSRMGTQNSRSIADAVAAAVGVSASSSAG